VERSYGTKTLDDNEAAVYITGPDGKIIGHTGIAKFCKSAEEANAVTQANADMAVRIAACLNACEGYDTAILEQHNLLESAYAAEVRQFELTTQRDDLLAALVTASDVLGNVQGDINPERGYADDLEGDVSSAFGAARNAIAKAGPQTKGAEDAARRVSACLAACKSISTKALEAGGLNVLQLQLDRLVLTQQRDRLVAVLEGLFEIGDVFTSAIEAKDIHASDFEVWEEKARAAISGAKGPIHPSHITQAEFDATPKAGPSIAEMQAAGQLSTPERYTHPTKGGVYEKLGAIYGAGSLKGLAGIAYCNDAGKLFIREPESFAARMHLIKADGGAQ
jgi:hypothetical protein